MVRLWSSSEGRGHPFEASCRSRSPGDAVSRIEWKGTLRHAKLEGDVWITLSGQPRPAAEVRAKRVDRERVKREATVVTADGTVANARTAEHAARNADRENAMLAAQGRRLHFTFTTEAISFIPVGPWPDDDRQPSTRPAAGAVAR